VVEKTERKFTTKLFSRSKPRMIRKEEAVVQTDSSGNK